MGKAMDELIAASVTDAWIESKTSHGDAFVALKEVKEIVGPLEDHNYDLQKAFDHAQENVMNQCERIVKLEAEIVEFKRIRDLLVQALCRATGRTIDGIEDPLTAAINHVNAVSKLGRRASVFYDIAYEALNIAGGLTNYVESRPALTNAQKAIERLHKALREEAGR